MSEDQTLQLVSSVLILVLVASGLFARRLPMGKTLRMFLIWLGIFSVGFVLFSFREEGKAIWSRVTAELSPGGSVDNNGTFRVRQAEDGHFWVNAEINGVSVRLMIDSGATTTALSAKTARDTNIEVSDSGFPVVISTANGTIEARRASVGSFKVGPIERKDMAVVVSPSFGDTNVVGMNFLSTLDSWRVEKGELLLNPSPPQPN